MNLEVAICYSEQDALAASELARYLDFHTSLPCHLAAASSPENYLDTVEQCLTYTYLLLLLSKAAVPKAWPRHLWEPVLLEQVRKSGVHMAFACLESSAFPQLLLRRGYFDLRGDFGKGAKDVRRWLLQHKRQGEMTAPAAAHAGAPDESLLSLVDQADVLHNVSFAAAAWFAHQHRHDFESVYWVDCANAREAEILGEMARAMQLHLPGTLSQNRERITEYARCERALFVFQDLSEQHQELAHVGGKASVIILASETRGYKAADDPTDTNRTSLHFRFSRGGRHASAGAPPISGQRRSIPGLAFAGATGVPSLSDLEKPAAASRSI